MRHIEYKTFYKAIALSVFLGSSLFVFSQTKIAVYNGNSAQKENKIFAASLVKSFTHSELDYEASDETVNIDALLKQQAYKKQNKNVPDTVIAAVCEKFEVDYLVNFTLFPQQTTKNVRVSLINANTFSVEKTKILTCNNLNNKTQVQKITDEIAAYFLFGDVNKNPENTVYKEDTIIEPTKKDKQRNLNGHYISLGSSVFSLGYYGGLGLAYEYRYWRFGFNASVGTSEYYGSLAVSAGCKLYFANKTPFLRNLYVNILPFCYFGQGRELVNEHCEAGDDYNIIVTSEYMYSPIFGGKFFFGYSPVWRVGKKKKASLGFNIDMGFDIGYKFNYERYRYNYPLYPFTWDIGFIIKFD